MLARYWDPVSPPVTMRTWTEIQHHQPARPYLGLSHRVEATSMVPPAGDVVGQLPGAHLAAEVEVFGDEGVGLVASRNDDCGGADLGEVESVEDRREAGGLETNRRTGVKRGSEREKETQVSVSPG